MLLSSRKFTPERMHEYDNPAHRPRDLAAAAKWENEQRSLLTESQVMASARLRLKRSPERRLADALERLSKAAALKALRAVRPKYLAFIPEIDFSRKQFGPAAGSRRLLG